VRVLKNLLENAGVGVAFGVAFASTVRDTTAIKAMIKTPAPI